MKRAIPLLLALLLLSACGRAEPVLIPDETLATEKETTTEPFVPTEGEADGITWRTVDVNSAEGREAQKWLEGQWEEFTGAGKTEFSMGKDKTILTRSDALILRDNKTGKDTTLLEKQYLGEETTPEEMREEAWRYPRFIQALDERYFVYCWGYWEGSGQAAVYDTKNMWTIPIEYGEGDWFTSQQLIFADALYLSQGTYGPYGGELHLMRVDLKTLDSDSLMAVDVLADIPGVEDVMDMNSRFVTGDERYFVLNDIPGLRVYDLQQKKLLLQVPVSVFGPGAEQMAWGSEVVLRDSKAYWVDRHSGFNYLAEIILP